MQALYIYNKKDNTFSPGIRLKDGKIIVRRGLCFADFNRAQTYAEIDIKHNELEQYK